MKPIEAHNQVNLGLAKCFRLALSGMAYRMFRSMVTISILGLAVAFLVHMLAYGLVANEVELSAYRELQDGRTKAQTITRLGQADALPTIIERLARNDAVRREEYAAWIDPEHDLDAAAKTAADLAEADAYLTSLPPAERAALTGGLSGFDLFSELQRNDNLDRFLARLASAKVPAPLGDASAFAQLIRDRRPAMIAAARSIRQGHQAAILAVNLKLDNVSASQMLAEQPEQVFKVAREAGFAFGELTPESLSVYAADQRDLQAIEAALRDSRIRAEASREFDVEVTDVSSDLVLSQADDSAAANWLASRVQLLREDRTGPPLTAERVQAIAQSYQRRAQLSEAVGERIPVEGEGFMGLPTRTLWLVGLSFLVCVVGVANAMLMSVTERFTEIATMKCLGAMDKFVMQMFVFEAAIQGVIGGLAGVAIGLILALLRGLADYGGLLKLASGSMGTVFLAAVFALVVGLLLATLAAVGPSWVAARLAPMEAMRVE